MVLWYGEVDLHLLQSPRPGDPRFHRPCSHLCSPKQLPLQPSPNSHHRCSPHFRLRFSPSKRRLLKRGLLPLQLALPRPGLHRAWPLLNPPHGPAPLMLCHLMLPSPRPLQLRRLVPASFSLNHWNFSNRTKNANQITYEETFMLACP